MALILLWVGKTHKWRFYRRGEHFVAERQYWGLLELLAQIGWFETLAEGYSERLYSPECVEGRSSLKMRGRTFPRSGV